MELCVALSTCIIMIDCTKALAPLLLFSKKNGYYLLPQLRDLAFSVDIGYSSMGVGALSDGLWRRASAAGASTPLEKRAFGVADDIYGAGLLIAYMAFIPFCKAGIMDGISLQRLLENTFRLDIYAAREYESLEQNIYMVLPGR
uniref:Uncharacterized protein n=1 Tax=Aegilops tauschii subsp. strangulata TaxID=200361 RepID=A0A453PBB9_AEGTS